MSFLIFFDDYTSILIAGNSMRKVQLTTPTSVCVSPCTYQVMQTAGVSKDKFAFIVQSMAPSMASFVPISRLAIRTTHIAFLLCYFCISWVGAQIGYVSSGLVGCTVKEDPFIIVAKTLRMSTPTAVVHTFSFSLLTVEYRFLPILMVVCVVIVCVLNRDFGPMLTAEKKTLRGTATITVDDNKRREEQLGTNVSDASHDGEDNDALFEG